MMPAFTKFVEQHTLSQPPDQEIAIWGDFLPTEEWRKDKKKTK